MIIFGLIVDPNLILEESDLCFIVFFFVAA